MAFEYKGVAEKQITKGFYSASAYVTSLIIVHIPFTLITIVFFFKCVDHGLTVSRNSIALLNCDHLDSECHRHWSAGDVLLKLGYV